MVPALLGQGDDNGSILPGRCGITEFIMRPYPEYIVTEEVTLPDSRCAGAISVVFSIAHGVSAWSGRSTSAAAKISKLLIILPDNLTG